MAQEESGKDGTADADADLANAKTIVVPRDPMAITSTQTMVDGNSPLHRGVLASDFTGPSYSELKRRAQNPPDNRLALPVGFMLHEYRIERMLGIGGFGISYLAHDANLNAKVAIKEYLPNDLAMRNEETAAVWAKQPRPGGIPHRAGPLPARVAHPGDLPAQQHRPRRPLFRGQQHRLHGDGLRVRRKP